MDSEDIKYSLSELEKYSYRILQQIAKSMFLPSNVKKMYLIQMIHAKKFKSEEELNSIIYKVKQERQQMLQTKKKGARRRTYLQGTEISSTSNSLSPPISMTPKRPGTGHIVIRCSPENIRQAIAKYNARQSNLTRNTTAIRKTYQSPKKSDRVLRSFNIKTTRNDLKTESTKTFCSNMANNYVASNPMFSVLKPQNITVPKEMCKQRFPKMITESCMVKKYKPVLIKNTGLDPERSQLIPATRNVGTQPMVPAKRQRVLSGIYPILPKEPPKISYEYLHSVGFRRQDGKLAKINALVQKRHTPQKIEVTVQDIINCNIANTFSNPEYVNTETNTSLTYSTINQDRRGKTVDLKSERNMIFDQCNFGNANAVQNDNRNIDESQNRHSNTNIEERKDRYTNEENCEHPYSVYYHKKIRGEQVRSQRGYQREVSRDLEERLPKINDVFSRFNAHTEITQPIYVQVSDDSERFQSYPVYVARTNTNLLESLYNFRSPFLFNQPLQQIPTTANTRCVYSTPVIATAMAQKSTALPPDCTAASSERDSYYSDLAGFPRICELLKLGEQENMRRGFRCDEELSTSSSLDDSASQELGASVTIPEMVEDALELISQDGDYMERIGMDVRVQCVICTFVCPKFLLEYHIRKEHSSEIHEQERNSWSMSYSLGALRRTERKAQVLAHEAALYVLTVRHHNDCLHVSLHTLLTDTNLPKSGSITIYNKVSGEPFRWEGEIKTLPHNTTNFESDGLKVLVSKLDLLPNSANLKLLHGELVLKSPTNVVVGQPELDDIHVILFVNIFN